MSRHEMGFPFFMCNLFLPFTLFNSYTHSLLFLYCILSVSPFLFSLWLGLGFGHQGTQGDQDCEGGELTLFFRQVIWAHATLFETYNIDAGPKRGNVVLSRRVNYTVHTKNISATLIKRQQEVDRFCIVCIICTTS